MSAQPRRTRARQLALQALYQLELRGEEVKDNEVREFLTRAAGGRADRLAYAQSLVDGCWRRRRQLDELIRGALEHWSLDRLAVIDRCVLRLGAYEMLFEPSTPAKVAIDEAIELAKRFSTERSGPFVNGILDRIYHQHAAAQADPDESQPT